MSVMNYDETGKLSLDNIYNCSDPTSYFSTLKKLNYCIPQKAKPVFERVIAARQQNNGARSATKIVDVGCSYGVNAALLKHGYSMDELYDHYTGAAAQNGADLLARDRQFYSDPDNSTMTMVGLDQAERAIGYAVESGAMDAGVVTDLETGEAAPDVRAVLAGSDVVISTGCVGYVSEVSLERVLEASLDRRPWMGHMVLRMFSYEAVADMLKGYGYVTEKAEGLYPQRRFASEDEKQHVIGNLSELGIDPDGIEGDDWYAAEFYLSRPMADAVVAPLDNLLSGIAAPSEFAGR